MAVPNSNHVLTAFPNRAIAVTADVDFENESTIYVGAAGDVVVVPVGGTANVTFVMQTGSVVPVRVKRVVSAGTTATGLVRVY